MDQKLVALKLVLAELGISNEIETVNDRKRVQKAVYLAQLSGVDLGYRYSWYLMGPYSPSLTRDYYDLAGAISEGDRDYERVELKRSVHAQLGKISPLIPVPKGVTLSQEDWLELLSSVHYLRTISGFNKAKTRETLQEQKSHVIAYVDKAEIALEKAGLLAA